MTTSPSPNPASETLEDYLAGDYHRDREDIIALERVLQETGKTMEATFREETSDWPYECGVQDEEPSTTGSFSQSTSAMMIHALDLLLDGGRTRRVPAPYSFSLDNALSKALGNQRKKAREALAADLKKTAPGAAPEGAEAAPKTEPKAAITFSRTFGWDDPITLSFLAEVASAGANVELPADHIKTITAKLLELDPSSRESKFFRFDDPEATKPLTNGFIPLRIVRAAAAVGQSVQGNLRYLRYFLSTLHDQLSYSSIPDSRFDPAELIFCLEGVLAIAPQSIDGPLFDRILEVLAAAQRTSAHWRPTKPFLRDQKGMALFPVSVEAANSLLSSCAQLDFDERFHRYSEKYIGLFRRFWEWLSARRVQLTPNIRGWHSDHVSDPETIQLWDTAQVVGFLLGYRRSLHTHIARTTLRLARFQVRRPEKPTMPWSEDTRAKQETAGKLAARTQAVTGNGDEITPAAKIEPVIRSSFEPVTSLGAAYETYGDIEKSFVVPWLNGKPDAFSMLLYGPPGTGKTTVAENLADALQFPLITITVSDFLAGNGTVEARAKIIFDVLEAQANCVILFDEIDELVLDRSSPRHANQDTVFKFMTPGMLTKLNNLRRAKRSIFVMATNYAYRIDPAIRRTGRIDENYLLLPPDAGSRRAMLERLLEKAPETSALKPKALTEQDWTAFVDASFFLGYKDVEAAVNRALRHDAAEQTVAGLKGTLLDWGRTTTLQLYRGAFTETDDRKAIEREFFPLVKMAAGEGASLAEHDSSFALDQLTTHWQDQHERPVYAGSNLTDLAMDYVAKRNGQPATTVTTPTEGPGEGAQEIRPND